MKTRFSKAPRGRSVSTRLEAGRPRPVFQHFQVTWRPSEEHGWLPCFNEYARLGSHADRAVCGKRGHLSDKSSRLAASAVANALTVATNALFIDRSDLNRSCGTLTRALQGQVPCFGPGLLSFASCVGPATRCGRNVLPECTCPGDVVLDYRYVADTC